MNFIGLNLTRVADLDPHYFGKQGLDPHKSEQLDSGPHLSQNSGALKAQNGRSQRRLGGSKWSRRGSLDQWSKSCFT